MEMHQIRYFLAVSRLLNFTRAAEECNVAQPSLTRAVKLLEDELGGELFRRERNLTHLTELGTRMLPLIQQCFDSAQSAKQLASSLKSGAIAPLRLALSRTINMELFIPDLSALMSAFPGLELKFMRGDGSEVAEALKKGDAEIGVTGPLSESWGRFDSWPLFEEPFTLLVEANHPLASRNSIELANLKGERLLQRAYCEQSEQLAQILGTNNVVSPVNHVVASEQDLGLLLKAGTGIAIAPRSTLAPQGTRKLLIDDLGLNRSVNLVAVAGRQRSAAAATFMKVVRAADWPSRLSA